MAFLTLREENKSTKSHEPTRITAEAFGGTDMGIDSVIRCVYAVREFEAI